MTDEGLAIVNSFLDWVRRAVRSDPAFNAEVEKALADVALSPPLRHEADRQLDDRSTKRKPPKTSVDDSRHLSDAAPALRSEGE